MDPRTRQRHFVLAGIVTAIALLLGGGAVVQFRAESTWRAMQAEQTALQAAWDGRPHHRRAAWGETTGDVAFRHYERATTLAKELSRTDSDELLQTLRSSDEQVATERIALRQRWQPVLDALRAGAHAADVTPPGTPASARAPIVNLLDCRWVANAAVFEARALRHQGEGVMAVQHTLDAATFGADLVRRGLLINQMIGGAILAIGGSEAWPETALARLDRDALDLLALGLERIDRELPETLDQRGELLFLAHSLQQVSPDPTVVPTPSAWRYGFSTRWMLSDAFTRTLATAREFANASHLAWPQRKALIELELGQLAGSGNPVLVQMVPNLAAAEQGHRHGIARLRLLRMSVDLHRGRDVPPLRDPLGDGPIHVTRTDEGVRLHCADADDPSLVRLVRR